MTPHNEPFLCRLIRKAVDIVYPDIALVGTENIPQEPCVLVGNHSQAHGPIITEERLPFDHYTWCSAEMMHREEVAEYAFADFWSQKPKSVRWIFWLISRILPIPASYIMSNARTIPVYRDSRCLTTFKRSVEKLQEGFHLVIFPERHQPYNNILYDFQDRFIDVARLYYKKTGKCLAFVPMYLAPKLKKVFFCPPVVFDPTVPMDQERQRIRAYLMDSITKTAIAQPRHTVIPYANIPKRDYPQNTPCEVTDLETNAL